MNLCIERLENKISKNAEYEVKCSIKENKELLNRKLNAYFDCLENNKLWEFKCVKALKNEHFLQLSIYMYIHKDIFQKKQEKKKQLIYGNDSLATWQGPDIFKLFFNKSGPILTENVSVNENTYQYLIFNILTNEIYQLDADLDSLREMIEYLIHYKYYSSIIITDKQFIERNKLIYNNYFVVE